MKYVITLELKPNETTLEEVLHARGRSATPVVKRRRVIPMKGQVITNEECLKEIKGKEEKKMQTAKQKKKTKQHPKKKKVEVSDTDSTTVSTEEIDYGNTSSDISLSDLLAPVTPEATDEVNEQQENADTNHDMMPKLSDDSVNKYYAVFYTDPKLKYYWGKVTKTFTNDDDDDDIEKVEVDFLQQKAFGSNPHDWTWCERPVKDIEVLESQYIFYGPGMAGGGDSRAIGAGAERDRTSCRSDWSCITELQFENRADPATHEQQWRQANPRYFHTQINNAESREWISSICFPFVPPNLYSSADPPFTPPLPWTRHACLSRKVG
ncbi:hypothetical protein O3P69_016297 [Scylla paramamosain]|uniref:Uncharacterized protein n=1 Tax=Scylla paramamosain TaxID=85552 RepID=A0AAW0SAC6_SCYPA